MEGHRATPSMCFFKFFFYSHWSTLQWNASTRMSFSRKTNKQKTQAATCYAIDFKEENPQHESDKSIQLHGCAFITDDVHKNNETLPLKRKSLQKHTCQLAKHTYGVRSEKVPDARSITGLFPSNGAGQQWFLCLWHGCVPIPAHTQLLTYIIYILYLYITVPLCVLI